MKEQAVSEWRPIESAPRDGTVVLVYDPDGLRMDHPSLEDWPEDGIHIVSAFFDPRRERWSTPLGITEGWPDDGPSYDLEYAEPTHWMTLPKPPQRTEP